MTPAWIEALAAYEAVNGPGPSAFHLASEGHPNAVAIVRSEMVQQCWCGDPECRAVDTDYHLRLSTACVALIEEMDPDGSKRKALDDNQKRIDREYREAQGALRSTT